MPNPYFERNPCLTAPWAWELSNSNYSWDTCHCLPQLLWGCMGVNDVPTPLFGSGYAGFRGSDSTSWRTFLGGVLSQPLTQGIEYTVEFYYRPWRQNQFQIDHLGIWLGNDSIWSSNFEYYSPYIEYNIPITDTTKWTRYSGSFIAQGGEGEIWIGNFKPDSLMTFIPNPPFTNSLYRWVKPIIFVDGVFVYKTTDTLYTATLPKDTLLCGNQPLVLQPLLDGFLLEDTTTTYLWSTGSTDRSIVVTQPGTYWVQTTINQRFVAGDTIVVEYFPANYRLNLPDTVTFCEGEQATILATPDPMQLTAYLWSTGSTLTGIKTSFAGLYWLEAQTPCYPLADSTWVIQDFCENYLWIPNAFTPNGDGINDYFEFQGAPEPVKLSIYDRWGTLVYYNDNYNPLVSAWDGTYQGQALPTGAYTYLIEYLYINPNASQINPEGSKRQVRGVVNLIP